MGGAASSVTGTINSALGGFGDVVLGTFLGGPTVGLGQSAKKVVDAVLPKAPDAPRAPGQLPKPPEQSDEAIVAAKIMERRRQIGLMDASQTWLTGARGDNSPATVGYKTLLGE